MMIWPNKQWETTYILVMLPADIIPLAVATDRIASDAVLASGITFTTVCLSSPKQIGF